MKKTLLLVLFVALVSNITAQKSSPTFTAKAKYLGESKPLRDSPILVPKHNNDPKNFKFGHNRMRFPRKLNENALPLNGDTKAQRDFGGIPSYALEEDFEGTNIGETAGFVPPDPTGAVGPNHYVHAVNSSFKIFNKSGAVLAGPSDLGTLWPGNFNDGDPIILYDQLADRWFISQFKTSTNGLLIAVSTTPDPTGTYNVWEYPLDSFPDYPHYTIWHDAYYLTANKSANNTYALDRQALINGDANPAIVGFTLPGIVQNTNTVFSPEPANLLGTSYDANTPGYIVYLQDDGWSASIPQDHLKIWEIDMDWVTTSNSTVSPVPLELNTVPFEATFAPFGTGDVGQPGTAQKIDMIGGVISYMVNYRKFAGHNSMIITFNVDVDGNDLSGIRWFELRNDSSNPWSIYQEGTYAPADGHSRFMGSAAIDAQGNIGLGFNIASSTLPVGIRYTGRYSDDPLGTMTLAETTIVNGVGVQTFSNRFGDYSHLTMDPDDQTFWHTAEYFNANNAWSTRIASFTLSGGFDNDLGVSDIITPSDGVLGATETVQVRVRNYGNLDQSNFDIELRLDDVLVATETYAGTLTAGTSDTFTFVQTVNMSTAGQTYSLKAKTTLGSDGFTDNDEFEKSVTHLLGNDVGVTAISAPTTGEGLGDETVSITIMNFGANPQSNFNVSYTLDSGSPVVEMFTGTINSGEEATFDFAQTGDFSALGMHDIDATTSLGTDQDNSNDALSAQVEHLSCNPTGDCSYGDGFTQFTMIDISNTSTCSPSGYGDFTAQSTNVMLDTAIDVSFQSGYSDQTVSIFIDFNDNFVFEPSELVVTDFSAPVSGVLYTTNFTIPNDNALAGTHLMRARSSWTISDPSSADGCADFTYGETEDYTVVVESNLSIEDDEFNRAKLLVYPTENSKYEVLLDSSYNFGDLKVEIYNTLGQVVLQDDMSRNNSSYSTELNFKNQATGVYMAKVFNGTFSTVKRVVVK